MASTYVNALRLNEMGTGDESGSWGTVTNLNLDMIGEALGYGTENMGSDANTTITMADGAIDEVRNLYLKITSTTLSATRTVTLAPNTVGKVWIIENATTGSRTITIKQGSGATIDIPNGDVKIIATDGAGSGAAVYDLMVDLNVATKLTVKNPATSASPATLLLQSGDTDIAAADVLGKIQFQAPDEATGTDAILVAAAIEAVSEGDFSSSSNATKLSFKTGASEAATEKMTLSSAGDLTIAAGGDIITATAGTSNFRAGVNAGDSIESGGNYNVVVGDEAGTAITTGDANVAVGYIALNANTTAIGNTALGTQALYTNTTGATNTASGYFSLYLNTTGAGNTASGYQALYSNTTAAYNVATGYAALYSNTTGVDNTASGFSALYTNTTGYGNTATGDIALYLNTTGAANTAVGQATLYNNTTANHNTAMGYYTLYLNTTGASNVALGNYSMYDNTTGSNNISMGYYALGNTTTAHSNVALGFYALGDTTTGSNNTASGRNAGRSATTGAQNTYVGAYAGDVVTTGTYNICIGYYTDPSAVDGDYQIVIGNVITGTEDNQVTIGRNSNVIRNEFDTDATWTRTSDERKKRNIKDDKLGLEFINNLRTVTHQWKPSNEFPKEWDDYSETNNMNLDAVMHGMIAQEVKEALDKSGCDTFAGWKEQRDGCQAVSREMFVIPLIKAVQELSAEVKELKEKLNDA